MGFCSRCGKQSRSTGAWCGPCHDIVMAELHARQAMPVGGQSCPPRDERRGGTYHDAYATRDARRRGGVHTGDDSPWQQNAVRALEDAPEVFEEM